MAKRPSRTTKKVKTRKTTVSPSADVKPGQTPNPKDETTSASKPAVEKSTPGHNATEAKKPPIPQKTDTQPKESVKTPVTKSTPVPAASSAPAPAKETSQPAEKAVEPISAPPEPPEVKSTPVLKPGPESGKESVAEPKSDTQPPGMEAAKKSKPTSPPEANKPSKPVAQSKPAPESVVEQIAEPTPAPPPKQPEESHPVPMPAEAESVHVEEPVPDEVPAEIPAAPDRPELFIVHISPEMAPVAKVGGLADVVFGLSGELAIRGNHVEIILPKYDNMRYDHIYELHEVFNDLWVPWYDGSIHCTVYFGFVHGRKCFFIEPHSGDDFFNRGSIYGFPDDILRFAFFSRAAMEFLWQSGKHPDIIHCHDWQSALVPVLLYEIYQQLGMTHPRVCLTIHNYKHQGVTGMEMLRAVGLHDPDRFFDYNRLRDNNNLHALNLLKGGIVYSNFITTVSPRYSMETRDLNQGFGLEPTLHTHQVKYGGVLNGIDYDVWNPEVDHLIPARYGLDNIDAKYDNKRALRHRLMLADNDKPIVAFIGRLDPQKGLDLVRHGIFQSLERGAQFVLLGSSPDDAINADFWNLKGMLNDSPDCHLEIGYDEELSHLIYAGADMLLVPSQFEPCGLTQLISLRYGTIPVVRAVGGLADTVFDKDQSHRPLHERNGYVFEHYDNQGLESALGRAIDCYYQYPEHFRDLIRNAMQTDYSWNHPGQDYMNIYDFIRNK